MPTFNTSVSLTSKTRSQLSFSSSKLRTAHTRFASQALLCRQTTDTAERG